MANETYSLDKSATEVNLAVNNVVDAVVTDPNKALQSGTADLATHSTVYTAVNDIQVGNFNSSTLIESGETFPDSDNKIPTCGAVVNAIGASAVKVAQLTAEDGNSSPSSILNNSLTIPFTVLSDPDNIISSVSDGVITPTSAGLYQIFWTGTFQEGSSSSVGDWRLNIQEKTGTTTTALTESSINNDSSTRSGTAIHNNLGSTLYSAYAKEVGTAGRLYWSSQTLVIIKLT